MNVADCYHLLMEHSRRLVRLAYKLLENKQHLVDAHLFIRNGYDESKWNCLASETIYIHIYK